MEIKKVVIPAAGLGSRFLPYTKSIPKEMLPLINKPAIQLVIEECAAAILQEVVLITNKEKSIISDHFEHDTRLQDIARGRNKSWAMLDELENTLKNLEIHTVFQREPLGLGHAIWLARHIIQQDYFGICLPDDIIFAPNPAIGQLIALARQENASVIAVQEMPTDSLASYGVVGIKKQLSSSLFEVSHMVEKPHPKDAPSNLAIVGRYVLSPLIFNALENMSCYAHEELQLTPAISRLIHCNERVLAYKIQGTRYDIGTPVGWLKAIIGTAWDDPVYGPQIRTELNRLQTQKMFAPKHDDLP